MLCLIVKTDLDFFHEAVDILYEEYEDTHKIKDGIICLNMSPITANTIRKSNERGGTPSGWSEEDQTSTLASSFLVMSYC